MSAEGLSHSLRWVRAKLADKQQSAQTSPHLNRSRSWTLHSAPIGEKGIVLSINFFYLLQSYCVCRGALLPLSELLHLLVHKKRLCSWRGTSFLEQQRLN